MSKIDNHRGRIQAQGEGFDDSESWSQEEPPTTKEGLSFLQKLINKIPKPEFLKRKKEFQKAEKFIKQAGQNGGVDAKVSKTYRKKGTKDIRVDIEVQKGTAFVPNKDDKDKNDDSNQTLV